MTPLIYDPPEDEIVVLHRDAALLLVEKPAGLLSVPGKDPAHRDCLLTRLEMQTPGVLLVHRLDMDTSGVMVFARNKAAQRHLGLQFERRHLSKTYQALVRGEIAPSGRIEAPLTSDWPNRPLQKICHETGKAAITDWKVLGHEDENTRLELIPQTGRSHQLRVHLLALGVPILGDRFYSGPPAARLMLHASALRLRHPDGGAWREFFSQVPF